MSQSSADIDKRVNQLRQLGRTTADPLGRARINRLIAELCRGRVRMQRIRKGRVALAATLQMSLASQGRMPHSVLR
jgi:hypothetical protein